jgi:TrbB protein
MSEQTVNDITTEIHGQHLQVRLNDRSLFCLNHPTRERYQLTLEQDAGLHTLWMRQSCNGFARLFVTDSTELAARIMNITAEALNRMAMKEEASQKKSGQWKWLIPMMMFITVIGYMSFLYLSTPPVTASQDVAGAPLPAAVASPMAQRAILSPEESAEASRLLASRLKNAAAKKAFTIRLSSGHARSLYLFSDPQCQNCRLFDPAIQALSRQYNVEIFPVTLYGKARTAAQVVPLLCAPAEKRAAMWRRMFADGAIKPEPRPASCETGQQALARNDMAFELWRLPGTPTVISDDGRMIPLKAMTSHAALQAFLNSAQ